MQTESGEGALLSTTDDGQKHRARGLFWFFALACVIACILLRRQGWNAGWVLDDYLQQSLISGNWWPKRGMWDLHTGARPGEARLLIEHGVLPWWTDPSFGFAPFRPLTSLLLWREYHSFWPKAFRFHLVSVGLWSVFALLSARLYRGFFRPGVAFLALVIFVFTRSHSNTTAWVASQAVLVASIFVVLSVIAYAEYRKSGSRGALLVYALAFELALLGGESGFSAVGYFVAYEALAAKEAISKRAWALAPAFALSIVHLIWYRLGGHGMRGVAPYVDVFQSPGHLWQTLSRAIPAHVVECLSGWPIDIASEGYGGWCLALVIIAAIVRRAVPSTHVEETLAGRWLFVGGMLALLPYGATVYGVRLNGLAKLGLAAGMAVFIADAAARVRKNDAWKGLSGPSLLVAAALAIVHVGVAPFLSYRETAGIVLRNSIFERCAVQADLHTDEDPEIVWVVSALNVPIFQTVGLARWAAGDPFIPWRVLSGAFGPHLLERKGPNVIEIETTSPGILYNATASAYRQLSHDFKRGDVIRTRGLKVEVLWVVYGPVRMRFTFDEPLESPHYRFMKAVPEGYEPFTLPRIGERVLVPAALPPPELDSKVN